MIIPAKDEADRIAATVKAAHELPGADLVVVVDDGSSDGTGRVAREAGAKVIRHSRNRGKGAAMETGAEAVRLLDDGRDQPRHLLFLDADLAETARDAGAAHRTGAGRRGRHDHRRVHHDGEARRARVRRPAVARRDPPRHRVGGHAPLNGQRCLTRAAFDAALPLAPGFGVETALTIDLLRQGFRVTEVEVPLAHRATGDRLARPAAPRPAVPGRRAGPRGPRTGGRPRLDRLRGRRR